MKILRRTFLHLTASAVALPTVSRFAWAQTYPSQPVRIIVPFAPGGATDIIARLIGQRLSERLGQQFVIENRPGGGGNIGTEAVVRAPADGYTLLMITSSMAQNAALYDKPAFNFPHDIAAVASVSRSPIVMQVHPSVPVKTERSSKHYATCQNFVSSRSRTLFFARRRGKYRAIPAANRSDEAAIAARSLRLAADAGGIISRHEDRPVSGANCGPRADIAE
jgi:Uncharacterized protein conserved in bacteria